MSRSTLTHVPSRSTIVGLSSIVETLAMTTHEQDLVHSVEIGVGVQRVNDLSESLPLSIISSAITRVSLVYEAKVDCSLYCCISFDLVSFETSTYVVKARSNSVRLILQEVASDSTVADVSRALSGVQVLGFRMSRQKRRGDSEQQTSG